MTGLAVIGIFLAGAFFGGVAVMVALVCYAIGKNDRTEEERKGE